MTQKDQRIFDLETEVLQLKQEKESLNRLHELQQEPGLADQPGEGAKAAKAEEISEEAIRKRIERMCTHNAKGTLAGK